MVVWRRGGGQFRGFTHYVGRISILLRGRAGRSFKRDKQIRFIVGDLELNLGDDAIAKKRWQGLQEHLVDEWWSLQYMGREW
jgi:hypothetical protein